MEITTVVRGKRGGFVINGSHHVPDDMGNRHRVMIQEWIDDGGVVGPSVGLMTPYQKWHSEISELDREMSRSLEDTLEGMPDKSGVAQITLDRLQTKKDLRATQPKE